MASPGRRAEVHHAFARALAADPDRATWHRALAASRPDEELAAALDTGAQLYLSHRTVGSSLYRVFPKLDVRSRAQLRTVLADVHPVDDLEVTANERSRPARGHGLI